MARVPYVERPFVRPQYDYGPSARIGDLIARQGANRAHAELIRGQQSAQNWATFGDLAGRTLQTIAQYQQDEPKRQAEALELSEAKREITGRQTENALKALALKPNEQGVLTYDRDLLTRELTTAGYADRVPALMKDLDEADAAALGFKQAKLQFAQQAMQPLLRQVAALGYDPQVFKSAAEHFVANGFLSKEEVAPYLSKATSPQAVQQIVMGLSGQAQKTPEDFTLNPGDRRFSGATNQQIAEGAPRQAPTPPKGPDVGSFEDFVLRKYGPQPTEAQILQARRQYSDAGREPNQMIGTLPAATQRRVDAKSSAFNAQPAVKKAQVMADSIGFAQSLDTNTKNPADDQALIYAFAKAMDPDSVVREGEYATVQKYAQSWADSLGFNAQRIFSNTAFLTPQARANMKATILSRFDSARKQYDAVRKSYVDQINQITGSADGDTYLTDYGAAFPVAPDAAPGGRGPNPFRKPGGGH